MSFAFSRRSFLKYTAVAAVAVAGASLFTGCKVDTSDSYNALRTTPGELTVLQVTAAMGPMWRPARATPHRMSPV